MEEAKKRIDRQETRLRILERVQWTAFGFILLAEALPAIHSALVMVVHNS